MSLPTGDPLQKLLDDYNEASSAYNDAVNTLLNHPKKKIMDFVEKVAEWAPKLAKVPRQVWEAIYYVIRCEPGALVGLTLAEIRQLLEVFKALCELEIAGLDPEDPDNINQLEALGALLQQICEALDNLPTDPNDLEGAIELVDQVITYLKESAELVLKVWLVDYFSTDFLETVKNAPEDYLKSKGFAKFVLKKVILQVFKKQGKKAAKKLFPMVGAIFALVDLVDVLATVQSALSFKEMMDNLLIQTIDLLAEGGADLNCLAHVWLLNPAYVGGSMKLVPKLQCTGPDEDGNIVMQPPKTVSFADGTDSIEVNITEDYTEVPFEVDQEALSNDAQADGATHCLFYIEVNLEDSEGNKTVTGLVAGAEKF